MILFLRDRRSSRSDPRSADSDATTAATGAATTEALEVDREDVVDGIVGERCLKRQC
jgi:hypothetical protein